MPARDHGSRRGNYVRDPTAFRRLERALLDGLARQQP